MTRAKCTFGLGFPLFFFAGDKDRVLVRPAETIEKTVYQERLDASNVRNHGRKASFLPTIFPYFGRNSVVKM
jgi:hypothetical protein